MREKYPVENVWRRIFRKNPREGVCRILLGCDLEEGFSRDIGERILRRQQENYPLKDIAESPKENVLERSLSTVLRGTVLKDPEARRADPSKDIRRKKSWETTLKTDPTGGGSPGKDPPCMKIGYEKILDTPCMRRILRSILNTSYILTEGFQRCFGEGFGKESFASEDYVPYGPTRLYHSNAERNNRTLYNTIAY